MAIRKVARLGHPVLRMKARELAQDEIASPEIQRLIQDMADTMHEYGGIGLAAPQIHEPIQLAIIELPKENTRYPGLAAESVPLSVFINPKITVLDGTLQGFWEGCLSVPGLRGYVERPRIVRVDYLNAYGEPESLTAEGFLATVFQHELDHLQGVVYLDRIKTEPGKTKLAFNEEYDRYLAVRPEEELPE
jgi:peptide deformylase